MHSRIKQWQLTARHFGQVGLHHICTQLIKAKTSCNQLPMSYIIIKINLQVIYNIAMSLYYIIYTIHLMLVAHWALLLSHCTSTSFEVMQKKHRSFWRCAWGLTVLHGRRQRTKITEIWQCRWILRITFSRSWCTSCKLTENPLNSWWCSISHSTHECRRLVRQFAVWQSQHCNAANSNPICPPVLQVFFLFWPGWLDR